MCFFFHFTNDLVGTSLKYSLFLEMIQDFKYECIWIMEDKMLNWLPAMSLFSDCTLAGCINRILVNSTSFLKGKVSYGASYIQELLVLMPISRKLDDDDQMHLNAGFFTSKMGFSRHSKITPEEKTCWYQYTYSPTYTKQSRNHKTKAFQDTSSHWSSEAAKTRMVYRTLKYCYGYICCCWVLGG